MPADRVFAAPVAAGNMATTTTAQRNPATLGIQDSVERESGGAERGAADLRRPGRVTSLWGRLDEAAADRRRAHDDAPGARLRVRAAIVHDWFQGYHGAERTVAAMAEIFEEPPAIFTFSAARELLPHELAASIVAESRFARLPGVRQRGHDPGRWRWLLPYMPRYFRSLKLNEYDLVISSSHACAVHARARDDALHVCYCYTPMRYAWMPEAERRRVGGPKAVGLRMVRSRLRRLDLEASRRPDAYLAISTAVRDRIRWFYGRDARVVHPPVETADFDRDQEKEAGTFLWVQRLVSYKRPEVVVEAFRDSPFRLTMVGVGPLDRRLRRGLPANVELRGWVDRTELANLYAQASGFIHLAEEDFGISMVEALAAGTPVIALDAGGARDIVRHGIDGVLVDRADPECVRSALAEISEREWPPDVLAARAAEFSRARFLGRFRAALTELVE